jgi:DNA end-binding protein Ku
MAARAYWTGQIRLALVSIPVKVFPATKSGSKISFNQIHKPSGKRIRYEKVVPGIGAVDTDDIVKGFQVSKGKYVLLSEEEIDDVKLEAKRTIDLVSFVDRHEIDPIYFDRPFFVAAEDDEVAGEAYVVLRDALKKSGKVGLGQIVARGRSSIVALSACGKGLILETLRYADEIQKSDAFFADVPKVKPEKELMSLAEELIERKAGPFNPKQFKDSYDLSLRELIDAKIEKRAPEAIEEPQAGAKVINLMDALKRSVSKKAEAEAKKAPSRPAAAKKASPRKSATRRKPRKTAAKSRKAA